MEKSLSAQLLTQSSAQSSELSDFIFAKTAVMNLAVEEIVRQETEQVMQKVERVKAECQSVFELALEGYKFLSDVYQAVVEHAGEVPVSLRSSSMEDNLMKVYEAVSDVLRRDYAGFKYGDVKNGLSMLENQIRSGAISCPAFEFGMVDFDIQEDDMGQNVRRLFELFETKRTKLEKGMIVFRRESRIKNVKGDINALDNYPVGVPYNLTTFGQRIKAMSEQLPREISDYKDAICKVNSFIDIIPELRMAPAFRMTTRQLLGPVALVQYR